MCVGSDHRITNTAQSYSNCHSGRRPSVSCCWRTKVLEPLYLYCGGTPEDAAAVKQIFGLDSPPGPLAGTRRGMTARAAGSR